MVSASRARRSRIRCCPAPFKRAGCQRGPDERAELLALWHKQRRSLLKSPQHLLNQAEFLLGELPLELGLLVTTATTTLDELCGLSTRSVAELLVEIGDPRRFTEGGFARFNGSAPLAASTAEGPGEPVRHRLNPGGNRRVNAILHRMAVTQLRCEPRAQAIY